jgi:hypothetical protein
MVYCAMTTIITEDPERRRRREREPPQGTTLHQHGVTAAGDEVGGRFAARGSPTVIGTEPTPQYPAAGSHQRDPSPDEPGLGYSVDQVEPIENPAGHFPPRLRLTREEAMDWSNVDPRVARMFGLVAKDGRR